MAAPTVARTLLPIAKEIVSHTLHTGTHKALHAAGHRSHFIHKAFAKCPWIMDACIIGVMLVAGHFLEGSESHESATHVEHAE